MQTDGQKRPFTAERIFINTGGRPAMPRIDGIGEVPTLDSTSIMQLDEVPEHLLVLGGGYIGLEFGQMFRRFGSNVTIVQRANQLLGREDADVAEAVLKIMQEDGIRVLVNTEAVRVRKGGTKIELTASTPGGEETLSGTHLLVAVGS